MPQVKFEFDSFRLSSFPSEVLQICCFAFALKEQFSTVKTTFEIWFYEFQITVFNKLFPTDLFFLVITSSSMRYEYQARGPLFIQFLPVQLTAC